MYKKSGQLVLSKKSGPSTPPPPVLAPSGPFLLFVLWLLSLLCS
jgi:hypothetical protein